MKPGMTYGIIFFIVFLLVTAGVYYIAETQPKLLIVNIPFVTKEEAKEVSTLKQESKRIELLEDQLPEDDLVAIQLDPASAIKPIVKVRVDTVYQDVIIKDTQWKDSLLVVEAEIRNLKKENTDKTKEIERLKTRIQTEKDEKYTTWLKSTVKMYEAMNAKQAAKYIQKFSDSEARDLIYAMKKKKAAEVLANLDEETVTKLTGSR